MLNDEKTANSGLPSENCRPTLLAFIVVAKQFMSVGTSRLALNPVGAKALLVSTDMQTLPGNILTGREIGWDGILSYLIVKGVPTFSGKLPSGVLRITIPLHLIYQRLKFFSLPFEIKNGVKNAGLDLLEFG